jgi:hypothetical protein
VVLVLYTATVTHLRRYNNLGGKRAFPFETQTVTLHVHPLRGLRSMNDMVWVYFIHRLISYNQDLAFHEIDKEDEENLKQKILQVARIQKDWKVIIDSITSPRYSSTSISDVQLISCYPWRRVFSCYHIHSLPLRLYSI